MSKCNVTDDLPPVIKRNADLLCLLSKSSPRKAKEMIAKARPNFLKALSLISYNLLNNVFTLKKETVKKMSPYAENFRALARKSLTSKKRRVYLQKGGFLGAILGLLGSVVVPKILNKVLKK